ncbi:hypothetical protein CDL60_16585 [Roseateles noduli]|nr:hypothetical protein CDL60_16585 [Roseateles noduli]
MAHESNCECTLRHADHSGARAVGAARTAASANAMSRRILVTGAFRFPEGDAAAFRVQGLARLLTALGWVVEFAGWESDHLGQTHYQYQGWNCYAMGEFRESELPPLKRLVGFLTRGQRTLAWMDTLPRYDAVIAYNPPAWFAHTLLQRSRSQGFLAVLDTTEWYESSHLPGGKFGLAAVENWCRMRVVYPRFDRVISISRFLFDHFRAPRGVRMPPLIDPARLREPNPPKPAGSINFVYAGQAGRKDRLGAFIEALPATAECLGIPVRLSIAGMTADQLRAALPVSESALGLVDAHGRLSRAEVQALYERSHFSVFFREDLRYAWAGFPTKATESWLYGCPIVTNRVGDIGDLIEDGRDGLLLEEDALQDELPGRLKAALQTIGLEEMGRAARDKAARCFSDEHFLQPMEMLLARGSDARVK